MKMICEKFPCSVCANHCKDYVKNNKIEKYIGVSIEINGEQKQLGMFIWSWKFHNAVNHRTKDKNGAPKKLMSWDTAYNMFSNNKHMCSAKCLEAKDFNSENLEDKTKDFNSESLEDKTKDFNSENLEAKDFNSENLEDKTKDFNSENLEDKTKDFNSDK
jgi:hypothetical protein